MTCVEDTRIEQANAERRDEAEAIAFVDLSGYKELTVEAGDERAAQFATPLQALESWRVQDSRRRRRPPSIDWPMSVVSGRP